LAISSVAVSKNVSRLERELGVRLLARSTRKLALTEEGRLFYARCLGPLRELEGARAAVSERTHSASGTLRVTSITPFAMSYVLPLIPAFTSPYPKIEIELHLDDGVRELVARGDADDNRAARAPGAGCVARRIAESRFVVSVPRADRRPP